MALKAMTGLDLNITKTRNTFSFSGDENQPVEACGTLKPEYLRVSWRVQAIIDNLQFYSFISCEKQWDIELGT